MSPMTPEWEAPAERTLAREGCTIHYWVAGPPNGPLVLLTHGAALDHHEWDPVVAALPSDYRVVTWDVRTHGASRPNTLVFTIPLVVEDLVALLDTLGAEQALLVGHSMGGNVTQEVLSHARDECKRTPFQCIVQTCV